MGLLICQVKVSSQFKCQSANNTLTGIVCVSRHVLAVEIAMTSNPYVHITLNISSKIYLSAAF